MGGVGGRGATVYPAGLVTVAPTPALGKGEAEPTAEPAQKPLSSLLTSFFFSLALCAHACVGAGGAMLLFWMPHMWVNMQCQLMTVNYARNETALVADYGAMPFFKSIRGTQFFDVPFALFLPACFVVYLGLSWRETALSATLPFAAFCAFMLSRWRLGPSALATYALGVMVNPSFALALRLFVLPKESNIPRQVLAQQTVVSLGVVVQTLISQLDAADEGNQLILACVVYPLVREIFYTIARTSARRQMLHVSDVTTCTESGSTQGGASAGGQGNRFKLAHDKTWVFFLWVQIMMGIVVRLHFSRISSTETLVAVTLYQALTEVGLRLSLPARDRMVLKCQRASAKVRRRCWVGGLGGDANSLESEDSEERAMLNKDFVSRLLVGECLAEYIAIWMSACLLFFGHSRMLALPFTYYNNLDRPFDDPLDLAALGKWTALQMGVEIIVDTISTYVEMRAGYDLQGIWRSRHKYFVVALVGASVFASVCAYFTVGFKDVHLECVGMDMCFCADDNGLQPGGLQERYCLRLYPDNMGLPKTK